MLRHTQAANTQSNKHKYADNTKHRPSETPIDKGIQIQIHAVTAHTPAHTQTRIPKICRKASTLLFINYFFINALDILAGCRLVILCFLFPLFIIMRSWGTDKKYKLKKTAETGMWGSIIYYRAVYNLCIPLTWLFFLPANMKHWGNVQFMSV